MDFYRTGIYDLQESIVASGYPMLSEYVNNLDTTAKESDIARAMRLASKSPVSGHANFLKGILVSTDIVASVKWWIQADRYSHFHIVSSMSTMHRALSMPIDTVCKNMPKDLLDILKREKERCKNDEITLEEFVRLLPAGLEYGARVTTNYMQLRIMYAQRKNHRLTEWRTFCAWCETLPYAIQFILCKEKDED